jgi:hypothetical protein
LLLKDSGESSEDSESEVMENIIRAACLGLVDLPVLQFPIGQHLAQLDRQGFLFDFDEDHKRKPPIFHTHAHN